MNITINNVSVVYPDGLLKGMKSELVLISPINQDIGVTGITGKYNSKHLIRLYQLFREEDQRYYPTHEIGAFTFSSRFELKKFVDHLPQMTALEILMLMSPLGRRVSSVSPDSFY